MSDRKDTLDWDKLMTAVRRKDIHKEKKGSSNAAGSRTEIERDYDRILFSAPIRRLADKTQVFPLDKNDSVRNRLTHSYEVSNLARSIGVALAYDEALDLPDTPNFKRDLPSMLAAVGLAHDVGNPPFGHQGENAIGSWFMLNKDEVFDFTQEDINQHSGSAIERMKQDYLNFEGNAQALRILTKLQVINDQFGLNVSCGTLAALMKYPTTSDRRDKSNISTKKFGIFHSEIDCASEVWGASGLRQGVRHPAAFIMEACDDIAYSVLDVEDAIKKGLVSYIDAVEYLSVNSASDGSVLEVIELAGKQHNKNKQHNLSSTELNDISMQMFRVFAIGVMVREVIAAFKENHEDILSGKLKTGLIEDSKVALLCKLLKRFAFENAFQHKSVLEIELKGHQVIHSLMDMMWVSINRRGDPRNDSDGFTKSDVFEKYVYSMISENYRRIYEDKHNDLPLAYKKCQLLGDMISGMTDSYAVNLERDLKEIQPSNWEGLKH